MPRKVLFLALAFLAMAPLARAQDILTATDGPCEESWFSHAVYCAPTSAWEARVGALFLRRSQLPRRVLASIGTVDNAIDEDGILTPFATTRDLNFRTQGGPEISLLRHGETADIEFRWFQFQDFVARTPNMPIAENSYVYGQIGPDAFQVFGPAVYSAEYFSQLNSFELNARAPENGGIFTPFCGFRYLEVNEKMCESILVPDIQLEMCPDVNSFNSLYGFQIGSDARLWNRGRLSLLAVGKTGIYGNHATNRFRQIIDEQELYGVSGTKNSVAFVGELGLVGTWQLSKRLTARLGYEILWVDGIAQAALQTTQTTQPYTFPVNTHGSAYYYGAQFGIDYRW